MTKWEVVDSYGAVVHTARSLTDAGVWIDPVLGIDFSGKAWGKRRDGSSIDADRFTRNDDGTYTVKMYEGGGGIGGELTIRKYVAELPYCPHVETFDCHGNQRCVECHVDSMRLKDGTLLWPSQRDPATFTADQIVEWFDTNKIYGLSQGCDGFEFARNNKATGRLYGYIWVEVTLDLDYEMCYLLDVRRHDGTDERRQYLFVAFGHDGTVSAWHERIDITFAEHETPRLFDGLRFFADQVEQWAARAHPSTGEN